MCDHHPDEADSTFRQRWQWHAIVALKMLTRAKTRLAVPAGTRHDLALAMALDTAIALRQSAVVAGVTLVTPDPAVKIAAASLDVDVLSDEPGDGLNSALTHAMAVIRHRHPGRPIALLAADLPAASPRQITSALREAQLLGGHAVLADATGTGTTLLTAPPRRRLSPRFGPDSFRLHSADGASALAVEGRDGIRHDVDTVADLVEVAAHGVGSFTRQALQAMSAVDAITRRTQ